VQDVNDLRQLLIGVCGEIEQNGIDIDNAIDQCLRALHACIRATKTQNSQKS